LHVVGCQDAETDRYSVFPNGLADSVRYRIADVLEMRRIATNHGTQTHECIKFSAGCHPCRDHGNFKCSRHMNHRQIVIRTAMTLQTLHCAFEQLNGDKIIESADDDAHFHAAGINSAFDDIGHKRSVKI
jgi:hypothetical protein